MKAYIMTYIEILNNLEISSTFLKQNEWIILDKLLSGGEAIVRGALYRDGYPAKPGGLERSDISGINQCLSLASSVLLLGSSSENLQKTLSLIQQNPNFSGQDPTTVVISIVLYYLLIKVEQDPQVSSEDKGKIRHIRQRFDELNWMISPEAVLNLNIRKAERQDMEDEPGIGSGPRMPELTQIEA
jgi:hypothetical protein